jgi:uncharacterized protein
MTYADRHPIYDADSHIMELPNWLEQFADASTREKLRPLYLGAAGKMADKAVERAAARAKAGPLDADQLQPMAVLNSKGWDAIGAFDSGERSKVLDALGFDAQLVFPTFAGSQFASDDLDLLYGGTDALNRAMAAFCADDPRLLAVGVIPWGSPQRTIDAARRAIDEGIAAIQVFSSLPHGVVSPTHPDHHPLWALMEEAGVPVLTHIGGGGNPVQRGFHDNGIVVTDFLGGGENTRSKDYLAIHQRSEVFWGAMVLDGILERFPDLRGASVEEGALWVVPWLMRLDAAPKAFRKTEPGLSELPLTPSEYVHRQLRFTPFPTESAGWIIEQGGDDLFMFSSDYPHPEGTRDPIAKFESTMDAISEPTRTKFYSTNFASLFHRRNLAHA